MMLNGLKYLRNWDYYKIFKAAVYVKGLDIRMIYILLLIVVGNLYGMSELTPVYVSLGRYCEPAYELRALGLRDAAYPFDWMATLNFDGVCRVIANGFKDFLNPNYLKRDGAGVLNTYYGMSFRHDFPTMNNGEWITGDDAPYAGKVVDNFLDYIDSVSCKYAKRIDRFLKLLDGSVKVVFIRTRSTPQEAQSFVAMMAKNYPLANYCLLVMHGDKYLNSDWNIAHVKSFYAKKKGAINSNIGWFHASEWKDMLIKFGCIQPNKRTIELDYADWLLEGVSGD